MNGDVQGLKRKLGALMHPVLQSFIIGCVFSSVLKLPYLSSASVEILKYFKRFYPFLQLFMCCLLPIVAK